MEPYLYLTSIYFVLVEICIYWMHRTLHTNGILYKYLHVYHHKYNKPDTLTSEIRSMILILIVIILIRTSTSTSTSTSGGGEIGGMMIEPVLLMDRDVDYYY